MNTFVACLVWMAAVFVAWLFKLPVPGAEGGDIPADCYLAAGMLYGQWIPLAGMARDADAMESE